MASVRRDWTLGLRGTLFLLLGDVLCVADAVAIGYGLRFHCSWWPQPAVPIAPVDAYLSAGVIATYVAILCMHVFGLYDRRGTRSSIDSLDLLCRSGLTAGLLLLSITYFYREFEYSRLAALYTAVSGFTLLGVFRVSWVSYCATRRESGFGTRRVLVVGGEREAAKLAEKIEHSPGFGYRLAGVADADAPVAPLLEEGDVEEVLIGDPALPQERLLRWIEVCEQRGIPIRMVPATYDLLVDARDFAEVGGMPLVTVNERRARPLRAILKRALDLTVSLLLIVAFAPFAAMVAVAIRLDSNGPVFYRQQRVGRDGVGFDMIKFRTMVANAEDLLPAMVDFDKLDEPVFKLERDPRVTAVGRWLRRFSVDEVPQLWNVVRGEMSLVGPRPEESRLVERYDVWERRRLKLLPGITGLQQIHCRGSQSLAERVRWDVLYLRKESFLLDLWILARTIHVVLTGKGAR